MRESISYTFLLNIVIIFVFTCFAIIMGVISYYKAFRANTIISEAIEKYEGYNCLSKEEIERRLVGLGYKTPFNVKCKSTDGNCDDSGKGYKVIAYNLDFNGNLVYEDEKMSSTYICDKNGCATNKHYQYGIYTYMYVDLPVVANIIKIPFFAKTSIMYDYRNYYIEGKSITDIEESFENLYTRNIKNGKLYIKDAEVFGTNDDNESKTNEKLGSVILQIYKLNSTEKKIQNYTYLFSDVTGTLNFSYRNRAVIKKMIENKTLDAVLASRISGNGLNGNTTRRECGYTFDYNSINWDVTL